MKRRSSFLWGAFVTLAAFSGCSPAIQPIETPTSAVVRVECHNAPVRQILELLRSGRAKDISVAADGSCITAAFSPADMPPGKLEEIMEELNDLTGVLHVEVEENPRPIVQNF
ncbi:MAG TPA: hypothetical protein VGS79_20525 [Puia sp.]|nr:hypothetical protein [Puia sp.]